MRNKEGGTMPKETFIFQGKRFVFTGSYFADLPIYGYKAERLILDDNKVWQHYSIDDRLPAQG